MNQSLFRYSVLTLGVVAAMGVSNSVMAIESEKVTTEVTIKNIATADYSIADVAQTTVKSNEVVVKVSEQVSFSLVSNNEDDSPGNNSNVNEEVAPNGFATFQHTLTNTGNRQDNYTIMLTEPDSAYDPANSTVSYTIYNADNSVNSAQENVPYSAANGTEFSLEKGQYIQFTINVKTNGNKGGSTQNLQISATSQSLAAKSADTVATVTNTDSSFTTLPTFSIVKTMSNALDLNDTTDTATYRVVVTNDSNTTFSADATDITITDILPAGLVLSEALTIDNITPSDEATTGTISTSNAGDSGFDITGVNIPVGQSVTIVFNVKQDGTSTLNPTAATNHAKVTDDLDDNPETANTLIDSTDSTDENVSDFYATDDVDYTNGETPSSKGDDSTTPLLTIQRKLILSNITTREIAPTSGTAGQVTHQTIITNDGKDPEGDIAGELIFTITDNDGTTPDNINIEYDTVTITYDADGAGSTAAGEPISITPTLIDGVNTYDIYNALPSGIAPNGTVTINYKVSSTDAPLFTPVNSTTATVEKTKVTLKPAEEGAPTQTTVEDTTTVRGLTLEKFQALDINCDGSISGTAEIDFTKNEISDALPDHCVIYRVVANNTFSAEQGSDIKDLVISDAKSNFSATAVYVAGSATSVATEGSTANPPVVSDTDIKTTISPLAPQGTATMTFMVKVKSNR